MEFVEATQLKNLPSNSHMVVSVNGKDVLLFNVNNEVSAIGNVCLHKGGPLVKARWKTNMTDAM